MSIKLPAYLHRNRHGVFGFRVVIPKSLRVSFPANEYRLSVGTSNKKHAKQIAIRMASFTQEYFHRVRRMNTNENELQGLDFAADLESQRDKFVRDLATLVDSSLDYDGAAEAVRGELAELKAAQREFDTLAEHAKATNDAALANELLAVADAIDARVAELLPKIIALSDSENAIEREGNQLSKHAVRIALSAKHGEVMGAQANRFELEREYLADFTARAIKAAGTTPAAVSATTNAAASRVLAKE